MKKTKVSGNSLYLTLGIIIITTVTLILSLNASYNYTKAKNKIIEDIKEDAKTSILSLKDNISTLMSSYSINEYEKLISNEIERKDIFAIVVNDYNMGEILSKKSYISGKIRDKDLNIINYLYEDITQNKSLKNCFYSTSFNIQGINKKVIGKITIYITNAKINEELNSIIYQTLINTITISFLLIILLFIAIKFFILKPIYEIITIISNSDKDGIPLKTIPKGSSTEINSLSNSMNSMINSIKNSRLILKESENRLEYLLEMSPIAVRIAKDKGENVIFANNAYSKLLLQTKDSTKGKNPKDYYANSSVYTQIIKALEKDETIYNKLVELKIEDSTIWALASYMNIEYEKEKAIIGWFFDVTKEKENEYSLYNALKLETAILDNSAYLMIRTNKEGVISQINKKAEKTLGYKAEELVGIHTPEVIHLESEILQRTKSFERELNQKIKAGFETLVVKTNLGFQNEHEWTYITKEGKYIPILLSITALIDKENKIYGYLGIAQDISQRKIMESQAKLASMGEMIGNIAHQWRQPLSVITTIASGIKVRIEYTKIEQSDILSNMDKIVEQTNYLSRTIDDFRNFIKNKDEKEELFLSSIIKKSLSILAPSLSNNNINLITNINSDIKISTYENQLIQAIINIINNAKDVLKTIKKDDNRYIFIETKKIDDCLILTIKDNGGGIKEEVLPKIFDPYFTTKHKSIGTGIGLSMAYQIITEHHNATIEVFNKIYTYNNIEYKGAEFKITFQILN